MHHLDLTADINIGHNSCALHNSHFSTLSWCVPKCPIVAVLPSLYHLIPLLRHRASCSPLASIEVKADS